MVFKITHLLLILPAYEVLGEMLMPMDMDCKEMQGYSGCACRMTNSNEVVSLNGLIGNLSEGIYPRFVTRDGITQWWYAFQPCQDFNLFADGRPHIQGYEACIGSGAAYFTNESIEQCHGLGSQEDAKFIYSMDFQYPVVSNLSLLYRNMTDVSRNGGQISLICNWSMPANESKFTFIYKNNSIMDTYYFSLESICCCPGGCPGDLRGMDGEKNRIWYFVAPIIVCALILIVICAFVLYTYSMKEIAAGASETSPLLAT